MSDLTLDQFVDCVGERYDLVVEGEKVPLVLETAYELPRSVREAGSFRLSWRGPVEPILPQCIYRLERCDEAYDIFIVPIAQDQRGTEYEAIFN